MQGILQKHKDHRVSMMRIQSGSQWEEKYCTLQGSVLSYAKSQSDKQECKSIDVAGAVVEKVKWVSGNYEFKISGGSALKHDFDFRATEMSEADRWVHALSIATNPAALKEMQRAIKNKSNKSDIIESGHEFAPRLPPKTYRTPQNGHRGRSHTISESITKHMTENERLQTEVISRLLLSYFDIVRKKVQDSVPKAITFMLIDRVQQHMHSELVGTLYKAELFDALLEESPEIAERRNATKAAVKAMEDALQGIHDVVRGF